MRHAIAHAAIIDLITHPTFPLPKPMPPHTVVHAVAHTAVLANAADVGNVAHAPTKAAHTDAATHCCRQHGAYVIGFCYRC